MEIWQFTPGTKTCTWQSEASVLWRRLVFLLQREVVVFDSSPENRAKLAEIYFVLQRGTMEQLQDHILRPLWEEGMICSPVVDNVDDQLKMIASTSHGHQMYSYAATTGALVLLHEQSLTVGDELVVTVACCSMKDKAPNRAAYAGILSVLFEQNDILPAFPEKPYLI